MLLTAACCLKISFMSDLCDTMVNAYTCRYDNTCALREKRLDIEEALAEEKKNNEQLKKDLENLQKKAKVIDSALKTAENELEAFQVKLS